jgi:hypothetical protein
VGEPAGVLVGPGPAVLGGVALGAGRVGALVPVCAGVSEGLGVGKGGVALTAAVSSITPLPVVLVAALVLAALVAAVVLVLPALVPTGWVGVPGAAGVVVGGRVRAGLRVAGAGVVTARLGGSVGGRGGLKICRTKTNPAVSSDSSATNANTARMATCPLFFTALR